jgi:NADPH-dependent curcumin reductase CurA
MSAITLCGQIWLPSYRDSQMAHHGRLALCGATSTYATGPVPLQNSALVLARCLTMRGFVVLDYKQEFAGISAELNAMVRAGALTTREDVVHGLEAAPAALMRLAEGKNLGKQLVVLAGAEQMEPLLCARAKA